MVAFDNVKSILEEPVPDADRDVICREKGSELINQSYKESGTGTFDGAPHRAIAGRSDDEQIAWPELPQGLLQALSVSVCDTGISLVYTNRIWMLYFKSELIEKVVYFTSFASVDFLPSFFPAYKMPIDRVHLSMKHQPGRTVADHVRRGRLQIFE